MSTSSSPEFTEDGKPITHQGARNAIDKIRLARGHIDDRLRTELEGSSSELRTSHYLQAKELREVHAKFTKTIAEQLYSSKSRLIYELLQNTDDSAFAPGIEPSITFRITPSHLIVDSNETGFTLANVQAICSTGESSKVGESDSTGEKGFGFKSVFSISHCVHIQSGLWSFKFQHKTGDDGVGMVTPIWTDPDRTLSSNIGTRLKLEFSDKSDTFAGYVVTEFEKLPNILVFALRRLRKITIILEGVLGRSDQVVFEKFGSFASGRVRIATTVDGRFGYHDTCEAKFRVFQTMCQSMPHHELRPNTSSMVTIAFETDNNNHPVIPARGQYVFAYLPVQRLLQLPFLIQADFVLLASRETIPENDWNNALLEEVANTFKDAVISLSHSKKPSEDPMSTRWMRYLPTVPMEGFWESLFDKIAALLNPAHVLQDMKGDFRKISDMRIVPHWFLHDNEPLLPDTRENVYLRDCYESGDLEILKELGLNQLSLTEIWLRLKKCLVNPDANPIHSKKLETDWHTAFAKLLFLLLNNLVTKAGIDTLKIIPLSDGQWMSPSAARSNPVYLPYLVDEKTVKIEIPRNLGLNKLHPTAFAVEGRRELYTMLEIYKCDPELVIQKILRAHRELRHRDMDDWRRDFEILFWFGKPSSGSEFSKNQHLLAYTKEQQVLHVRNIFLPNEDPYNAQHLLASTPISDLITESLGFLHPTYVDSEVRNTICFQTDWLTWLRKRGMSDYPSLTTGVSERHLSPAMKLVAKHSAEKFVPALKAHWSEYMFEAITVVHEIGDVSVPCRDNISRALRNTFVPTEKILTEAQKLQMESCLPLLKLPVSDLAEGHDQWSFLALFGVVCEVNSDFYLAVLRLLPDAKMTSSIRTMISSKLYASLAESSKLKDADMILAYFEKESLIYAEKASEKGWFKPVDCVWNGAQFLSSISVLSIVHGIEPAAGKFFVDFLNIRNANHHDIIKELEILSKLDNLDEHQLQQMPDIYAALADMAVTETALKEIRETIVTRSLIHVDGHWLRPSECLWNCSIKISGRVPLQNIYPDLRDFFVTRMGVATMSANVLARELVKASKVEEPKFEELKDILKALGQQLSADKSTALTSDVLNLLIAATFIPTSGPSGQQLKNVNADFCINDHKRYADAFFNKITMVDFDHEQMTSLHFLFKLLKIENRYLSRKVKTSTVVERSVEHEDLTAHLQERVHSLSCCAIYHNSPKYSNRNKDTHDLLVKAKVFTCDQIRTELTVNQPGPGERVVKVPSVRAVVKLEAVNGSLHVFVPNTRDGLYSCYCTELPSMLAEFLGIEGKAAAKIIYRILNDETQDLSMIMKDEDIPDYSWIEKPEAQQPLRLPVWSADHDPESISSAPIPAVSDQPVPAVESINSTTRQSHQLPVESISDTLRPVDTVPVWERASRSLQYKKLLQEIVRQARRVPVSHGGLLSLSEIDRALDDLDTRPDYESFRSLFDRDRPEIFEENFRIGAAGELFVFERLRSLGVANFGLDNWQSTIRRNVNILPEYESMPNWTGREISDIMYHGDCPVLRDFLVQNTSHPYPPWLDSSGPSSIQYHLEVKTTPGPCATPFFMGPRQYKLMKDKANEPLQSNPPQHLYVIVRVFNLVTSNIGLEVYINPSHLEDSVLKFAAEKYTVTPLVSQ